MSFVIFIPLKLLSKIYDHEKNTNNFSFHKISHDKQGFRLFLNYNYMLFQYSPLKFAKTKPNFFIIRKIVGQIPTGHLTTISVESAKVTIKMVKLSNNFGKNLWCTFTQILNEKNVSFVL